jgi:hypothetical protein
MVTLLMVHPAVLVALAAAVMGEQLALQELAVQVIRLLLHHLKATMVAAAKIVMDKPVVVVALLPLVVRQQIRQMEVLVLAVLELPRLSLALP